MHRDRPRILEDRKWKFFLFGIVGASGALLNTLILHLLVSAGLHFILASLLATEAAILSNFTGNHLLTFRDRRNGGSTLRKFLSFQTISLVTIGGTVMLLALFVSSLGQESLLVWNILAISIMFVFNFLLNLRITWQGSEERAELPQRAMVIIGFSVLILSSLFLPYAMAQETGQVGMNETDGGDNETAPGESVTGNQTESNATASLEEEESASQENESGNGSENVSDPGTGLNITLPSGDPTQNQTQGNDTNQSNSSDIGGEDDGNETGNQTGNQTDPTSDGGNQSSDGDESQDQDEDNQSSDGSPAVYTSSDTNLTSQGGKLHMYETESALFEVSLNASAPVTWKVDNETVKEETGNASSFIWTPGPLFTGGTEPVVVEAIAGSEVERWDVDVEFVINPFFTAVGGGTDVLGSPDTELHIFTNSDFMNIGILKAEIEGGGSVTAYDLNVSYLNNGSGEAGWKAVLRDVAYGDNYVVAAIATDQATNTTARFSFGKVRAHYRSPPEAQSQDDDDDDGGSSGGGGGGGFSIYNSPEVVYALFREDVIGLAEEQTLSLDANVRKGDIESISVSILTPQGRHMSKDLELVNGTKSYGTWQVSFRAYEIGRYILESVTFHDGTSRREADPGDVSFYLAADPSPEGRELELVYSALNASNVENGSVVAFTLDARDGKGIESAQVAVRSTKNASFTVPLRLISGNGQYGTWETSISAESPDTTYVVESVTLSNEEKSATRELENRQFYVEAIPYKPENSITGNVARSAGAFRDWSFETLRKVPLFPTVIGFTVAAVLVGLVLTGRGLRNVSKKASKR